jgi:acyl-CoA-binding protein
MPDIRTLFANAAAVAKGLDRVSEEERLALHALYQQATSGDAPKQRTESLDPAQIAQHDSWARLQGMSTAEAMQKYIARVRVLRG